jgi:glycosyltransferase involved in cell wall biosynthesis
VRILNVIQCTNLGGMERAALLTTKGLVARGHSVHWVSLNPLGRLKPLLDEAAIPCEGIRYLGTCGWRSLPSMTEVFRRNPADAIIMTGPNLAAMVAMGPRRRQPRLLAVHYHHSGVKPAWQWRLIYRMAVQRFHVITFPSDFIRREAESIYPSLAPYCRTVRNPIAVPPLPPASQHAAARQRLGLPIDGLVVGNAGWLIPRKRFDVFLRVAALVARSIPKAVFVIAGDGPERGALAELARELNIASKIHWLGWQTDLTDFYLSLDVLLFNSDWDAFPTTPLEAMSFAVPVVASLKHGGLGEVISSPSYGSLSAEHDLTALAHSVIRFLSDPVPIGHAGRQRICDMLDADKCVSQLLRELQSVTT